MFDTDTVTRQQMGRAPILQRYSQAGRGRVAANVVTMHEQLRGRLAAINRARSDQELRLAYERLQATQRYYCRMPILAFDEAAIATYRVLVNQRLGIATQDLRIAAIALANDVTVVTSNRRDFERVPGLRIEDWNVG